MLFWIAWVVQEQTGRFVNLQAPAGDVEVCLFHLKAYLHTDPRVSSVGGPLRTAPQREVRFSVCAWLLTQKKATLICLGGFEVWEQPSHDWNVNAQNLLLTAYFFEAKDQRPNGPLILGTTWHLENLCRCVMTR